LIEIKSRRAMYYSITPTGTFLPNKKQQTVKRGMIGYNTSLLSKSVSEVALGIRKYFEDIERDVVGYNTYS
jgi:hypothetical protein